MTLHKLSLLENAVGSFNEALAKYQAAERGDQSANKFAVLHFAHFLELLFKYYVSRSHPLLIYKNPFAKNLEKERTIDLSDAMQFLRNEGKNIDRKFAEDMDWLRSLRNSIEHFQFEMDTNAVRLTLGRLTRALDEFNAHFDEFEIRDHVSAANLKIFEDLSDQYKEKIRQAEARAREIADGGKVECCWDCFSDAAALQGNSWVCQYCEFNDEIITCSVCGEETRRSLGKVWNDEDPAHVEYACYDCRQRISDM